jgi:hypothetical protein
MRRRVFLQFAGAGIWNSAAAGGAVGGPLPVGAIRLAGHYGYRPQQLRDLPPGTVIDAREANFAVANSRNGAPVPDMTCEVGQLPTNPYPLVLRNCPGVRFVGGRFAGEVPMTSGWRETYCNSAALLLREGSSTPLVEEIRVRRAWDGVRFAEGCDDFTLRSSWLSDIRDDAVENDYLQSGTIEDCLFDGCFSGISIDPGDRSETGADRSLAIRRCLIRMQPFPTERGLSHGSPFKTSDSSPMLKVVDTAIALSSPNMRFRRLARTWAKLAESRNNLLLWLPEEALPEGFPTLPQGFQIVTGKEAQDLWMRRRREWIDKNPRVASFPDDSIQ